MSPTSKTQAARELATLSEMSCTGSLAPPSMVLLHAPSTSEAETTCCLELLTPTDPDELNVLYVDFTRSPTHRLDQWRAHIGTQPTNVKILSAGAHGQTAADQAGQQNEPPESHRIEPLASPGNLTQAGVQLTDLLDRWKESQQQLAVCFHSLSTLLHYVDPANAFQFLNTLKGHLIEANAIAHVHVEPDAHEEQTINQFKPLFDGIVDTTDPTRGKEEQRSE